MSLIILHSSRLPVIRIARIAGQYAKPRSSPTELLAGTNTTVLSFRGDNVNGYEVTDRNPDPERLLGYVYCLDQTHIRAYFHSTATLNYIRTLLASGFADLNRPLEWSFSHVRSPELQRAFTTVIESLQDSLEFMQVATGAAGGTARGGTSTVDFYTRLVSVPTPLTLQPRSSSIRIRRSLHPVYANRGTSGSVAIHISAPRWG